MSFIDAMADNPDARIKGSSNGAAMAAASQNAFKVNQLTNSVKLKSDVRVLSKPVPDNWRATQLDPSTEHSIPVLYGSAMTGGFITDAQLTNGNMTMWYCVTIAEKTGPLMSTYNANDNTFRNSEYFFKNVYWNDMQIIIDNDGVSVVGFVDNSGAVTSKPNGLVKMYLYDGNSHSPTTLDRSMLAYPMAAYDLFPGWTPQHMMEDLIFALFSVDYSYAAGVTGLGNLQFHVQNTLFWPGDVLYDYMTNTRYGCGIPAEEIYQR
jgi:hypothetical protein